MYVNAVLYLTEEQQNEEEKKKRVENIAEGIFELHFKTKPTRI